MRIKKLLRNRLFYSLNLILIFIRLLVGVYLREWELFSLPVVDGVYLAISALAIAGGVVGLVSLMNHQRTGLYFSLGVGVLGFAASVMSLVFYAQGVALPAYATILAALILLVSILQVAVALMTLRGIQERRRRHRERRAEAQGAEID